MGKDDKSIFNNIRVLVRRCWSFTSIRISAISITLLFTFICLYTPHQNKDAMELSSFGNGTNNKPSKRIACLVVGDTGILQSSNNNKYKNEMENLFKMLVVYDKYLHSYCDLKIFLVNTSISTYYYNSTQMATKLPHSEITFIPPTILKFWQRRRFHNAYVLSYTYKHYLNQYEWYLKFHDTSNLVFVDNFEKLVFDEDNLNKFDMTQSQILGHYIQYNDCTDFIYALSVYAINNQFIETIGPIAYKQVITGDIIVDDNIECESSNCKHHTENDFGSFCLDDLNVNIRPIRDESQREYFLLFQIKDHYYSMNEWKDNDWYWIGKSKQSVGDNCCAQYSIAFSNYKKVNMLADYYEKVYLLKPDDRNIEFMSANLK